MRDDLTSTPIPPQVFEGQEYHPMASLTDEVPVLSCGGLTKRFLVPGWRMGWITINDRGNVLEREVREEGRRKRRIGRGM